jgi:hypothetical protein
MAFANITLVQKTTGFDDLEGNLDAEPIAAEPVKSFLQASAEFATSKRAISSVVERAPVHRKARSGVQLPHGTPRRSSLEQRERIDAKNAWIEAHRDVIQWIYDKLPNNNFAFSLVKQYELGPLTTGQVVAVRKILAEDVARAAERMAAVVRTEPNGSDLDLTSVPEGFYAVPDGETRLKIKIERPTPPSKWSGFTFVSDGAEYGQQKKYGRQAPGKLYTGDIKDSLRAILADPKAASLAYGKLVGRCGICNRRLEDAESVERGIGPICMGKMGW